MIYYLLGIIASLIASFGQIFFKLSGSRNNANWLKKFLNIYFIIGNILFITSALMTIYVMKHLDFSSFYSLTAASYFFITILSRIILKESIDNKKILGNTLIIIGIIIYNIL
jgi:small multidrug resistance pump